MPFENKGVSRAWKIIFVDYIEQPRGGWAIMTRFEVISPDGSEKSIRPIFTEEFVDDYFRIPGDRNMSENRSAILKKKEDLFKRWSLVRIEECISGDCFEEEPKITRKDFEWAEKIEKGLLQPSSEMQNDTTYFYIPERRIGF